MGNTERKLKTGMKSSAEEIERKRQIGLSFIKNQMSKRKVRFKGRIKQWQVSAFSKLRFKIMTQRSVSLQILVMQNKGWIPNGRGRVKVSLYPSFLDLNEEVEEGLRVIVLDPYRNTSSSALVYHNGTVVWGLGAAGSLAVKNVEPVTKKLLVQVPELTRWEICWCALEQST